MANRFTRELKDPETGRWIGKEIWIRVRSGLAVLLSLSILMGGTWFVYSKGWNAWMEFRTAEDYIGEGVQPVEVTIPKGASVSEISDILVEAGVIKAAKAFDREAAANADSTSIQAGKYLLKTQLPAKLALAMLLDPKNIMRTNMTLKEGQRLSQMVKAMSKASGLSEKKFNDALKNWKKLGLPTWAKNGAEGFLFPDTYELPEKPNATKVIKLATAQFNQVADDMDFEAAAKKAGTSAYKALIVASIMEREVFRADDRPKVARVIYNRLKAGMNLQMDSTVAYAVGKTGSVWTTEAERQVDSPFNTYLHPGLPPAPISSPARKALEAAVTPAEGDWLYFQPVNLETGETEFNATYEGHLVSVAKLQAWCTASDENRKKCA
ncbi:MAG: endolytic transglycosylase MltG [Propionibacteriaceae bacterium]|mgnify:CR=1 FL=1|jgi:UPF0755 protein|nr:endolytic transglycosylase MltG [Propionibacteriaceae bacterium]